VISRTQLNANPASRSVDHNGRILRKRKLRHNRPCPSKTMGNFAYLAISRQPHHLSLQENDQKQTNNQTQTALISAFDALNSFIPSHSKRTLLARYPSLPWQECSSLAARQFGLVNVLLTIVRVHAGLSIHSYGAYNVGILFAAIMLVHYVSERMSGSIRGSALSAAEVVVFVTFVWMMVQREWYVGEWILKLSFLCCSGLDWVFLCWD
jgi:hypothetical protein